MTAADPEQDRQDVIEKGPSRDGGSYMSLKVRRKVLKCVGRARPTDPGSREGLG